METSGGRYNKSGESVVPISELRNPMAQGAFRHVAKGKYTSGPRKDEACVCKWFKSGAVFSSTYFDLDIKAVHKALEFVNKFNETEALNKTVKINVAEVWSFNDDSEDDWSGQKCLIEPFIQNYQKFNSNSGWYDDSMPWGEALQALSHFSYHCSNGNYVLCDLQGGIYQQEVVLSDPVILSRNREYGVTDLGPEGISSFFSQHTCNRFCSSRWIRPANPIQHFLPEPGTSMMRRPVPTDYNSPRVTKYHG